MESSTRHNFFEMECSRRRQILNMERSLREKIGRLSKNLTLLTVPLHGVTLSAIAALAVFG